MGPQGTGALYLKKDHADMMSPMNIGSRAGNVVNEGTITLNTAPLKFEEGVLNTAGVIGLGVAVDTLTEIGLETVQERIAELTQYMIDELVKIPEVVLYGTRDAKRLAGVISIMLGASIIGSENEEYKAGIIKGLQSVNASGLLHCIVVHCGSFAY